MVVIVTFFYGLVLASVLLAHLMLFFVSQLDAMRSTPREVKIYCQNNRLPPLNTWRFNVRVVSEIDSFLVRETYFLYLYQGELTTKA